MALGKTTLRSEGAGLSKVAKDAVPLGNVPVVEPVDIQLMMDRLVLRPVQQISDPVRSPQITVIEAFAHYREHVDLSTSALWAQPKVEGVRQQT